MRYQIALDGTVEYGNPGSILNWTRAAFRRFEEQAGPNISPETKAAANILLGNLEILSANQENMKVAVIAANRQYSRAVELTPYSAVARNMDAMARIYLGTRSGWAEESPLEVVKALQGGLALDTSNKDVTANLESLLTLISGMPESMTKIDKEALEQKRAAVRRVRAHQAKQYTREPTHSQALIRRENVGQQNRP